MGTRTVVADVAEELARRIAIGEYAPGDLMPSVRQVAEEFDMNRATAQLVLGRLETHGLVRARRNRGFAVLDLRRDGGVEVFRLLFRLSMPAPEIAVDMFRTIVDIEQSLVLDCLLAYSMNARTIDPALLRARVDELESLARAQLPDHRRMLAVEVDLVRLLIAEPRHGMQRAILNSLSEMLFDVPEAVAAFYASPGDLHVLIWRALLAVWQSDSAPSQPQLVLFEDVFTGYHEKVVARFEELVAGGTATTTAGAPPERRTA